MWAVAGPPATAFFKGEDMPKQEKQEKQETVEVTFKKEFHCYPDGINLAVFKKGKQMVTNRVAKLAKDCGAIK